MKASAWSSAVLTGLLLLARPVAAQESEVPVEFSGSATLVSDYTFRGISQTLEDPAIQGGIDMSGPGTLYLGVWGSSLNFGETPVDDRAYTEVDVFGGVAPTLGGLDFDLGFVYYAYPGTSDSYDYDFLELGLGVSRGFAAVTAGVSAAFSPDYFGASESALYLGGSLEVPIPSTTISLAASLGNQTIDDNDAFGTPNYMDWSVGATIDAWGLGLGASFVGTNIEEADCFGGSDLCKPRLVLSLFR